MAADTVLGEPLFLVIADILYLPLPLNSSVTELAPPLATNAADGAVSVSNLFSIVPSEFASASRSLPLERVGGTGIPLLIGIECHTADTSKIDHSTPVN